MRTLDELFTWIHHEPSLAFLSPLTQAFETCEVFFVGGMVRDWFLERNMEHKDVDLVVRGVEYARLTEWLAKHGTVDVVGKTFGVIKFRPHAAHASCIDITLPRTEHSFANSEGGPKDVSVQFDPHLPIETDLARRDFTVNAMAISLKTRKLTDPFSGMQDLAAKTLRTVGVPEERFKEDLTRILRGIRFASELGFEIHPETRAAMSALVPKLHSVRKEQLVNRYVVPREVIGDELSKALYANPARTLTLLAELGALEELFPSVWRHSQLDAEYLAPVMRVAPGHLEQAVVLLLRNLTEDEAKTTLTFTGLDTIEKHSNRRLHTEHVLWMVQKLGQKLTPHNIHAMRASQFEKQFLGARGTQHIHLLEHLGHAHVADAAKKRKAEICANWQCEEHEPIPVLLSGDDVIRLGIPAGPRIRELLEEVRDQQLDGHILTREQALRYVKKQME